MLINWCINRKLVKPKFFSKMLIFIKRIRVATSGSESRCLNGMLILTKKVNLTISKGSLIVILMREEEKKIPGSRNSQTKFTEASIWSLRKSPESHFFKDLTGIHIIWMQIGNPAESRIRTSSCAGNFKQSMGARNRIGIGVCMVEGTLSSMGVWYRPASDGTFKQSMGG